MADPLESRAAPAWQRLVRSVFHHTSLDEVAAAVAVAVEGERPIYVERAGELYRWSLCHRGGSHPLLGILAHLLKVDHHLPFTGFHTLAGGWPSGSL